MLFTSFFLTIGLAKFLKARYDLNLFMKNKKWRQLSLSNSIITSDSDLVYTRITTYKSIKKLSLLPCEKIGSFSFLSRTKMVKSNETIMKGENIYCDGVKLNEVEFEDNFHDIYRKEDIFQIEHRYQQNEKVLSIKNNHCIKAIMKTEEGVKDFMITYYFPWASYISLFAILIYVLILLFIEKELLPNLPEDS